MNNLHFYLYSFLGIIIWTSFWLLGGYFLGEVWQNQNPMFLIFIILLIFLLIYLSTRIYKYVKKETGANNV